MVAVGWEMAYNPRPGQTTGKTDSRMKGQTMMRTYLTGVLCLVAAVALVSCGDKDGDSDKLTIAVIPKCTSGDFWVTVERGARDAAKKHGVNMKWQGTLAETEKTEQKRIFESMVNLDVDGIAMAPLDKVMMGRPVAEAVDRDIPVVIFDSAVAGDKHSCFVATNNTVGGEMAGKEMIRLLGEGKGNVVVLRFVQGTGSTEARVAGFIKTVEAAGIKVLESPHPDGSSPTDCQRTAESVLNKYDKGGKLALDGIFACNLFSAVGMLNALDGMRDKGVKIDHVKFVGFDWDKNLVAALKDGRVDALIVQDPYRMGYLAVEKLVEVLKKKTVEKFVDTGAQLVTKETLAKDAALRKLIGAE